MHARITTGTLGPKATFEEFQSTYVGILERMGVVRGLEARILARSREPGNDSNVVMLSLWSDEDSATSYENSEFYRTHMLPAFTPILGSTLQSSHFDVTFVETYGS